jgi:hypothetical protein
MAGSHCADEATDAGSRHQANLSRVYGEET